MVARAKYFSPVPQMMRGRNRQAVTRHQKPTFGKKIFAPTMDDRVCEKVCEHIDDWQRSGWRSGDGVTMAIVGAKNISPVPKMM